MPNAVAIQPSATLITHCGANPISREGLLQLPTPSRTRTHTPIAHSKLVDLVEMRLNEHGIYVAKGEYAVQGTYGDKLFAALTLKHQNAEDFAFAMALRASNDKSMPVEFVAGLRVFICDNLALSGDSVILRKRHTGNLNVNGEISKGVDRAVARFSIVGNRIQRLKEAPISDIEAKALICDAAVNNVIPLHLLPAVSKNYFEPPHPEFEGRNQWSLHNAFTETYKSLKPNVALDYNLKLGKMFVI